MRKNIVYAVLFCIILGFSSTANAEGRFSPSFKAPFGLFGGNKKETTIEQKEEDLNVTVEKTQINDKPFIVFEPQNVLGVTYTENTINKAEFYIEEEDFESAELSLNSISEWVFDATEYHTDLFKTLKKLDNSEAQANIERDLAIKFAVLRDKILFLESKVHLHKGNKKQAVENLVEVVRSQPATDLGFKAYEMLQEIGFTYKVQYQMVK